MSLVEAGTTALAERSQKVLVESAVRSRAQPPAGEGSNKVWWDSANLGERCIRARSTAGKAVAWQTS